MKLIKPFVAFILLILTLAPTAAQRQTLGTPTGTPSGFVPQYLLSEPYGV